MEFYTNIQSLLVFNITQRASIDTMGLDIATGLRQLGVNVKVLLFARSLELEVLPMILDDLRKHSGPSFVMDINGRCDLLVNETNFSDEFSIPKFSSK